MRKFTASDLGIQSYLQSPVTVIMPKGGLKTIRTVKSKVSLARVFRDDDDDVTPRQIRERRR